MSKSNLCAKKVTKENAYEVWQSPDGKWTYYVLKKHKSPQAEAQDPFAKWHVVTVSPFTSKQGDAEDIYATHVMDGENVLVDNPLCDYFCLTPATDTLLLETIGILPQHMCALGEQHAELSSYFRVAVPKSKSRVFIPFFVKIAVTHGLRMVCCNCNSEESLTVCLADVQTTGGKYD